MIWCPPSKRPVQAFVRVDGQVLHGEDRLVPDKGFVGA
jgi:hypothetical protein